MYLISLLKLYFLTCSAINKIVLCSLLLFAKTCTHCLPQGENEERIEPSKARKHQRTEDEEALLGQYKGQSRKGRGQTGRMTTDSSKANPVKRTSHSKVDNDFVLPKTTLNGFPTGSHLFTPFAVLIESDIEQHCTPTLIRRDAPYAQKWISSRASALMEL